MTTQTDARSESPIATRRLAVYGVLAAVVATATNLVVRAIALGVFDVPARDGPLDALPIVNTTVVAVVGATIAYGLLARLSTRPTRYFVVVSTAVLALSFVPLVAPPAFLADAPASVLATLGLLHLTTAAAALVLLPRAAVARQTAGSVTDPEAATP